MNKIFREFAHLCDYQCSRGMKVRVVREFGVCYHLGNGVVMIVGLDEQVVHARMACYDSGRAWGWWVKKRRTALKRTTHISECAHNCKLVRTQLLGRNLWVMVIAADFLVRDDLQEVDQHDALTTPGGV